MSDDDPDLIAISFAFAEENLSVMYRGSLQPQQVAISIEIDPAYRKPKADTLYWISVISESGMIGGADFPPEAGSIRAIEDFGEGSGSRRSGVIEVTAMSPWFVRNIANYLVRSAEVRSMTIDGTLAPDGGPLSVDTAAMRRWMKNRTDAYVGRWPELGFDLIEISTPGKLSLKLGLRENVTRDHIETLELALANWGSSLRYYPSRNKKSSGTMQVDQKIARTKREIRAGKSRFDFVPGPSANLLLNGLSALNRRGELPIETVELAI